MYTVHVRVTDRSTGKPTPVRISFRDADDVYRPPLGRLTTFSSAPGQHVGGSIHLDGRPWAYIDGTCEVQLPAGSITVEIHKGPEYSPLIRQVQLAEGQISLRFEIDRWIDLQKEQWFPGDMRAHALSPHAALLEGAACGLSVVQLLAREQPGTIENLLAFSGTREALSSPHTCVVVNTLNVHPILGTVALLDSHRPVFPLQFGSPEGSENWSIADWCDQCHRKRGLVIWPDLGRFHEPVPQGEALASAILAKLDAFEVTSFPELEPDALVNYYRLLDSGMRLVLVGASGKDSNAIELGQVRTYARLEDGQPFSAEHWIHAVRAGHTFITNGPLLNFKVDQSIPGSMVRIRRGDSLRLSAEAQSTVPFDHLELLAGGNLIASKPASGNRQAAQIELVYSPSHSTWIAARAYGSDRLPSGSIVFAHTSPIWVEVEDQPQQFDPESVGILLELLDRTRNWIELEARCDQDRQRQRLLDVVDQARVILTARMG